MHARFALGAEAWVWCTDLPHLVHLLTFPSLLGYFSQHASLPCLVSFLAASEYGCARGFVGGACVGCVMVCGMGVVHILAPSCARADLLFCLGMSPRHVFISRVMLASSQRVSLVVQEVLSVAHARVA